MERCHGTSYELKKAYIGRHIMRSKDTGNGRKILAKVEVPLSIEDITAYSLRHLEGVGDNDIRETLLNSNKRQIFNMAKAAIFTWGTQEKAHVISRHNGTFNVYKKIIQHKFPECD